MEQFPHFLRGEIDVVNADDVAARLRAVAARHSGDVRVDCKDITFIDVAGLRAIIQVHAELAQQGRDLRLIHPSPFLVRVLQAVDLDYLLGGCYAGSA